MMIALRAILIALGSAALLICLSIMVPGPAFTASSAEHLFDLLTGYRGPDSGAWPATMDSELRFYAPFWGAYGLLLLDTARNPWRRANRILLLAGVFFAGGLGRAISWLAVGRPHPFFVLLMAIELVLPPVIVLLCLGMRRSIPRLPSSGS
jgi:hypothetical protein